jgi:hypothetical protein
MERARWTCWMPGLERLREQEMGLELVLEEHGHDGNWAELQIEFVSLCFHEVLHYCEFVLFGIVVF